MSVCFTQMSEMDVRGSMRFTDVFEGGYGVGSSLVMLFIDTLLYGFLAYYLDSIVPGEVLRQDIIVFRTLRLVTNLVLYFIHGGIISLKTLNVLHFVEYCGRQSRCDGCVYVKANVGDILFNLSHLYSCPRHCTSCVHFVEF